MTEFKFITLFAALAVFISCSEEEPVIEYVTVTETVVETQTETVEVEVEVDPYADSTLEGNISSDTTLDASKIWLLKEEYP